MALAAGCPGPSAPAAPAQGAQAQRTAAAEAAQVGRRLRALEVLEGEGEALRAAEATAVQDLRQWLTQRRQWRSEPYRVEVRPLEGAPLDRAALEVLIAAKQPVALTLRVPAFEPPPAGSRTWSDPAALSPLLDLLATPSE